MTPMFSDEFKEQLRLGKYTSWAKDLTADQLQAVLWLCGEVGCRYHSDNTPESILASRVSPYPGHQRAATALRLLARYTQDKLSLEQVQAAMRAAMHGDDTATAIGKIG